jgi:hypothetical protein
LSSINSSSFSNTKSTFYSCNTGTGGDNSFAQEWSNFTNGTTKAMVLKTEYRYITYTKNQVKIINSRNKLQQAWYKMVGDSDSLLAKIKEERSGTGYRQEGSFRFPVEGTDAYWKTYTISKK